MTDSGTPPDRRAQRGRVVGAVFQALVVVALLGAGGYAAWWFNATEGGSEVSPPSAEAARSVDVVVAEHATRPVRVFAMGTVRPALEATIRPRVTGMIVDQAEAFVPGGFFEAGATMVQIDRADYEQTLLQRRTEVRRAEAALRIELGDQAVAREELELLEVDIPDINRDLILRIPQVNQAEAQLEAARAAVQRVELDLARTRVEAPFDGHVVRRAVTVGNNVGAGDELAVFVGADEYWIDVSVPVASLRWLEASRDGTEPGSPVAVRNSRVWGDDAVQREGHVARVVGRLEQGSRLARVIVSVPDPLARRDAYAGLPELLLDAFVDVEIVGRELDDCALIERDLIREGDVVWVMGDDDRLVTKPVEIAYRGRDHAYVTGGLEDGDRVIRTNLQTPVDGMLLRLAERPAERIDG